jgi:hypothetical protein
MICAALAGVILVVLISLIAVYKATPQQPLLPLPLRPGEVADPSSRFVKLWPGRMGYFKFSDGLIFAIPPQYQPFWLRSWPLQRDQVARDLKNVVNTKPTGTLAFQFFLPNFSGYSLDNYLIDFHPARLNVIIYSAKNYSQRYFAENIKRNLADAGLLKLNSQITRYDATCYRDMRDSRDHREYCFGRGEHGDVVMSVIFPPYRVGVVNPLISARYSSMKFGGIDVRWIGRMEHFHLWQSIERKIWELLDEWRIDLPGSNSKKNEEWSCLLYR